MRDKKSRYPGSVDFMSVQVVRELTGWGEWFLTRISGWQYCSTSVYESTLKMVQDRAVVRSIVRLIAGDIYVMYCASQPSLVVDRCCRCRGKSNICHTWVTDEASYSTSKSCMTWYFTGVFDLKDVEGRWRSRRLTLVIHKQLVVSISVAVQYAVDILDCS